MAPKTKKRRVMWFVAVLAVASPLAVMALYVEDWSRDLTTNTAATDASAIDMRMRPIVLQADAAGFEAMLDEFCEQGSAWASGDDRRIPADSALPDSSESAAVVHLVRTTGLMRYRDDVWVVAYEVGEGRLRVHAESRSRIGQGDLGQNPRNLRELLGFLQDRLGESL